uniref:Uncharacterized protein n=1 Tax=Timema bartmani TaxID=61472 RepID=A0A7R9EPF3_9NEOP|nr:unnamed protein product [Timema bartmani]
MSGLARYEGISPPFLPIHVRRSEQRVELLDGNMLHSTVGNFDCYITNQDGAEPSGNSVSAHNLIRLAAFLDRVELQDKAAKLLTAFTSRLTRMPIALPELTSALVLYHDSPTQSTTTPTPFDPSKSEVIRSEPSHHSLEGVCGSLLSALTRLGSTRAPAKLVFVTGRCEDADTAALLAVVQGRLVPGRVLALADARDRSESVLYRKCEVIRRMKPVNGRAAAYVCRHRTCSLPVNTPQELEALLNEHRLAPGDSDGLELERIMPLQTEDYRREESLAASHLVESKTMFGGETLIVASGLRRGSNCSVPLGKFQSGQAGVPLVGQVFSGHEPWLMRRRHATVASNGEWRRRK